MENWRIFLSPNCTKSTKKEMMMKFRSKLVEKQQ